MFCCFSSLCSKPRPNVVYQPPSLYGDEDADVRRSLSILNEFFELKRQMFTDGFWLFFRGISNRSRHLWYSLLWIHHIRASASTVESLIKVLPSMKFSAFIDQYDCFICTQQGYCVWDTLTGTKTKWTNVIEPSSGIYHGCRFKWIVSADMFNLCPCVHQLLFVIL